MYRHTHTFTPARIYITKLIEHTVRLFGMLFFYMGIFLDPIVLVTLVCI